MPYEEKNTKYSYNKIGFSLAIATLERHHGILEDIPMKEPAQYSELMIKEEKNSWELLRKSQKIKLKSQRYPSNKIHRKLTY